MHCRASASASRSCSGAWPVAVAVASSLRSMAAGVSTDPLRSRGHGSVFSQPINVLRYTAISPRPAGPGGNRSRTSLSCPINSVKRVMRSPCRSSMASSSALAWSVCIRSRRASSTCWNSFGSRSATANSIRPRAMVSAASREPSAVRPSRGGRQSAIRPARSSTVPRPITFDHVCWSASSFRTASNSARVRTMELPVAALTRRLRSSFPRSCLNHLWAAPASVSAAQFTGRANAAGPIAAVSSHASTKRAYLPRHARREIGLMPSADNRNSPT